MAIVVTSRGMIRILIRAILQIATTFDGLVITTYEIVLSSMRNALCGTATCIIPHKHKLYEYMYIKLKLHLAHIFNI